jgi:PAS domain S-box-containing protein
VPDQDQDGFVPTDYVALFSGVFEYTSDSVCITRFEDDVLLDVNKSFIRQFELARGEAIGHRTTDLGIWLSQGDRRLIERVLRDQGRIEGYVARMRSRKGSEFRVSVSAVLAEWRGQTVSLEIGTVERDPPGEPDQAA